MKNYYTKPNISKWRISPVTVCVASICKEGIILGASDRMLTAGDIQFEPPQPKIWELTKSIAVMVAGDITIHSEVYQETRRNVDAIIKKDESKWFKVKEAAEIYSHAYHNLRSKRSEKEILLPLGLDAETFIKRQSEMSQSFINKITSQLFEYKMRDVGAIIVGTDGDKERVHSHIYVMDNGNIECHDDIGFAAIGAGYWHANSQFMFAGYTKLASAEEQLFDTFWAKKRAEVAPGVGEETDMFVIGPGLGTFLKLPDSIVDGMDAIYKSHEKEVEKLDTKSKKSVAEYLAKLGSTPPSEQQAPPSNPSENKKEEK